MFRRFANAGQRILALALSCVINQANGFAQASAPAPSSISATTERRAEIEKAERALPHIADRGAALFFLARRYAQVGEPEKALSLLKECIALDEGFDPSEATQFQSMHSKPEFQALVAQARRRYPPVHMARVAFTVSQTDLFPEGLAVDSVLNVFYMGSMNHKKIIRVARDGTVSDFVKPGLYDLLEIGGIKVDPADHRLWAASDNGQNSELLHFNAEGKLLERFSPPGSGPHVLNDLVLHGSSEIYVTDTMAHQVYRFERAQHTFTPLSFHRSLFYPNGITLSDDGRRLYVADIMGVIQVDLASNATQDVDPGKHSTLAGIDGLYWYKNSLVGVEYGNGPYRVVHWQLSPDGLRVTSTKVLEYRTSLVSFPTTGAIAGGKFYYITNTGIANYQDGKIVDPKKLEPIKIAVVALQ